MSEWKAIETLEMANGLECDIWHTSLGRITGVKVIKGEWHLWGNDGFDGNGWVRVPQTMCVTHWMPLPAPPSDHLDAQAGGIK